MSTMEAYSLSQCTNGRLLTTDKRKKHDPMMYGIDRLADEILIAILSRLTLKEAVRASVILRGWRYLWQFTSGRLELKWNSKCSRTEFVRWVDQVVKLHQGSSVDEFIVHCHAMGLINTDSISNWVHFAVQKDVRVFDLAISGNDFPDLDKFLSISNALKSRRNGFFSLTSLKLDHANVKDVMIEYLLANCPHLEHLCIKYERYLKNLNVVCPSLKSLVIHYCSALETLTISATNLVYFEFGEHPAKRPEADLQLQNVPLLSEFKLQAALCVDVFFLAQGHPKYSHFKNLLERVHLHVPITAPVFTERILRIPLLQYRCLKHLELFLNTAGGDSLLFFVFFTLACPFLSRLNIELHYCLPAPKERTVSALHSYKRHQKDLAVCQHQHLKVVKLINFACFKSEFRFALALLQIANSLEKMVIKPGPGKLSFDLMPREPRYLRVRERAKQLEANLPHGAKLLIL